MTVDDRPGRPGPGLRRRGARRRRPQGHRACRTSRAISNRWRASSGSRGRRLGPGGGRLPARRRRGPRRPQARLDDIAVTLRRRRGRHRPRPVRQPRRHRRRRGQGALARAQDGLPRIAGDQAGRGRSRWRPPTSSTTRRRPARRLRRASATRSVAAVQHRTTRPTTSGTTTGWLRSSASASARHRPRWRCGRSSTS